MSKIYVIGPWPTRQPHSHVRQSVPTSPFGWFVLSETKAFLQYTMFNIFDCLPTLIKLIANINN